MRTNAPHAPSTLSLSFTHLHLYAEILYASFLSGH